MRWGEVRWGEVRWGEVRWGEERWGELSWGELRWGDVRWGEVRSGELLLFLCLSIKSNKQLLNNKTHFWHYFNFNFNNFVFGLCFLRETQEGHFSVIYQERQNQQLLELYLWERWANVSTVNPVFNGHPWDLKNVAVKQRVIWKRSVVSRLQAGC